MSLKESARGKEREEEGEKREGQGKEKYNR